MKKQAQELAGIEMSAWPACAPGACVGIETAVLTASARLASIPTLTALAASTTTSARRRACAPTASAPIRTALSGVSAVPATRYPRPD